MRVNPTMASPGDLPKGKDKNPARYVRGGVKLLPKLPGMAAPITFNHVKSADTYRTGMGEVGYGARAGSQDALRVKSVGVRT